MEDGNDLGNVGLIDVFSEDDILLSSPRGLANSPGHIEGSVPPINFRDKSGAQLDPIPTPSDSPEPKNCALRYSLRKSLAWDSAFFTSEGVLDAEELADVNNILKDAQKQTLPRIPEDARKSFESNADLNGNSCAASKILSPFPDPKPSLLQDHMKGSSRPPRIASRIPILPSNRRSSSLSTLQNREKTECVPVVGKSQPVTAPRRLPPSRGSVNSHLPEKSKNTRQVREQRKKCGPGIARSDTKASSVSPSSSVESFTSGSSSSSIPSTGRPASSSPALKNRSSCPSRESLSLPSGCHHLPRKQLAAGSSNPVAKEPKPSGLRLPSPKIGYFDTGNPQKNSPVNRASRLNCDARAVNGQRMDGLRHVTSSK